MTEDILKGEHIVKISTIGSQYANGYLRVFYRRKDEPMREARVHIDTLFPILQKYDFKMARSRAFMHLKDPKEKKI